MRADSWLQLGHHLNEWGDPLAVGLPAADLNLHLAVLGTSGSGKSTLLRNLVLQYYGLGGTVVVIEPHGDLVLDRKEGILAALHPAQLPGVAVIDLDKGERGWPTQFNLASATLASGRSAAVKNTMRSVHAMEEANWGMAVRMREILENTLHILLDVQGEQASLVALHRFLTHERFRREMLEAASPSVELMVEWWERHLMQWADPKRRESLADILEPAERRLFGFLRDPRFRHSLALPVLAPSQALDLDALLNDPNPHLVLLLLRGSRIDAEGKRVFGTLFMQQLSHLFKRRSDRGRSARRPVLILIDEFADLAGSEVGEIVQELLAQARKFGAGVVLGAQSLSQLPYEVRTEVKNNTSNKIILRTASEDDARIGVANLGSGDLEPSHLMNVERFHGYARTTVREAPQPPFYFRALPPVRFEPLPDQFPMQEDETSVEIDAGWFAELQELHRSLRTDGVESVLGDLVRVDPVSFRALVTAQVAANRQAAHTLLTQPEREPDPVQRALKVSRARYGLPWWFYEAQHRRLRLGRPC
ncbi:MAG: ATP-binding protein [Anaerolineales bacterium]|nr:ATP-binding protein [Anaerolineales bacterium]